MIDKIRMALVSVLTLTLLTATAFAQMGSGMGSGGMQGSGQPGTGMGAGMMGANGMMDASMGSGMMNDLTVGPDGTVYVVRPVQAQAPLTPGNPSQQYAFKQELAAISPADGTVRWKLELTGSHMSELVVGKDGKLFLGLDDGQMMAQGQQGGGMMNPGTSAQSTKSRFLVISATATSAVITRTLVVDSDILGAPQVVSTGLSPADYVIYVTGMDMPSRGSNVDDRDSIPAGEKTLYAFLPDGSLKFKVKIGQTMVGIPPR
ncbi:MAG: hypothetical protein HY820_16160 [Acidobacteria bacterium]|nr:hypothetical protein [Acidobacteriota bacterium]